MLSTTAPCHFQNYSAITGQRKVWVAVRGAASFVGGKVWFYHSAIFCLPWHVLCKGAGKNQIKIQCTKQHFSEEQPWSDNRVAAWKGFLWHKMKTSFFLLHMFSSFALQESCLFYHIIKGGGQANTLRLRQAGGSRLSLYAFLSLLRDEIRTLLKTTGELFVLSVTWED